MPQSSYILFGPEDTSDLSKESMGKYFYDCLKRRGDNEVINVDVATKEVLTTRRLLEESIKFTAVLKDLSIQKDDVIAIIAENTINYFTAALAALYLGVIVNPLNPSYTAGELKHTLVISKPKLILCSETVLKTVLKLKKELDFINTVILMDSPSEDNCGVDCIENLLKSVTMDTESFVPQAFDYSEQGAFILLSSGTTGLPKCVLLTHQNLRTALVSMTDPSYGGATSDHLTILFVPYFHVYGVLIQTAAIITSMKVVVMSSFKPEVFLKCIEEHKATKLFIVPPILNFLANSPLVDNYDISSIWDVICGAAPAGEILTKKALQRLSNASIRQAYGLTELCGPFTFDSPKSIKMGSVGNLVPDMVAKVCDSETQETVGPLKVGELCCKGPGIMKGYIGNPVETENCIDRDGFFHTGDMGFYDEDNRFYIVGRLKEIIKYKGFQVAPAELEVLLLTHPDIMDCGVIGIPDERAGELPFAFIVCKTGSIVTEKEIVDFVAERISVQKHLYGGVRFINEIPKNPSGKILRLKLLEIFKTY